MDPASYGELVHELFLVVVARTKLAQKYSRVLDSESEWARVCRSLITVRDGGAAEAPQQSSAPPVETGRWWLRPRGLAGSLMATITVFWGCSRSLRTQEGSVCGC